MQRDSKGAYLDKQPLQDNVFPTVFRRSVKLATGLPGRKGMEDLIIAGDTVVNAVSSKYGLLKNEDFFLKVEEQLINSDIEYNIRSINRENRSFVVDYILNDESYHINIKNGMDKIRPMLRFTNSYDGSCKTSGHFGFYREVCSNGLHVAHSEIGFTARHTGNIVSVVLPEIKTLVNKFLNNEYYSLHKKFEVLAETPIEDINDFIKVTAEDIKLFQYEISEKNTDPSKNARLVQETILKESKQLGVKPNMWLGYNAFNELLHGKLKKSFPVQKRLDSKLFERILEMTN